MPASVGIRFFQASTGERASAKKLRRPNGHNCDCAVAVRNSTTAALPCLTKPSQRGAFDQLADIVRGEGLIRKAVFVRLDGGCQQRAGNDERRYTAGFQAGDCHPDDAGAIAIIVFRHDQTLRGHCYALSSALASVQ